VNCALSAAMGYEPEREPDITLPFPMDLPDRRLVAVSSIRSVLRLRDALVRSSVFFLTTYHAICEMQNLLAYELPDLPLS
jgi:hypothetical protein